MWPGGQVWKPGPPDPATVAAWPPAPSFRIAIFCRRVSLTPVAAPNVSPNVSPNVLCRARYRSASTSIRSQSHGLTRFRTPCPDGASHTSPGCQPWEPTRKKESRVLKERRITAELKPRPRPSLCGVPSEHTDSLRFGSQGDALGWHALPRWGKWNDNLSDTRHD